jgi:hypothetical protein
MVRAAAALATRIDPIQAFRTPLKISDSGLFWWRARRRAERLPRPKQIQH